MQEKSIVFIKNRKGLKMALKIVNVPNATKWVIMEHGLASRKDYPHMKVMEEVFSMYGYNVINMDATNSLNESEQDSEGITFTKHYEDLEDVITWAKSQGMTMPFALAGQSLGAAAVVRYASMHPHDVHLVVAAAFPWLKGSDAVKVNKKTPEILRQGYYDQVSKSTGRTLRIYKNYLDDMADYDFSKFVHKIIAETHLIIGLEDSEYRIESNKKLYDLLTCKKTIQWLSGVPHDLANTPETKDMFTKAMQNIFK